MKLLMRRATERSGKSTIQVEIGLGDKDLPTTTGHSNKLSECDRRIVEAESALARRPDRRFSSRSHRPARRPPSGNTTEAIGILSGLRGHTHRIHGTTATQLDRQLHLGHRRRRPPRPLRARQVPRRDPADDRPPPPRRRARADQAGRARHEGDRSTRPASPNQDARAARRPPARPSTTPRSSRCATSSPAPASSSSRPTSRPTSTASRPTSRTSSTTSSSATRSRGSRRPTRSAR